MGAGTMGDTKRLSNFQIPLIVLYLYLVFSEVIPIFPSFLNLRIRLQAYMFFAILFIVTGLLILNSVNFYLNKLNRDTGDQRDEQS